MAWRVLHLTNPSSLRLNNKQLSIFQKETRFFFAVEDLACVVVDHPQISLTVPLLSELAQNKVPLLVCTKDHLPSGLYLPYLGYSRPLQSYEAQNALTVPQKKQLWREIVKTKLYNQSCVLSLLDLSDADFLLKLSKKVTSGDQGNLEAIGAKRYWKALFGKDFIRSEDTVKNAALNYVYSLVRSLLARSLAAAGYYLPLGVHHKNKLNPFNLVDDLFEPFRPFVDCFVYGMQSQLDENELSRKNRQKLVEVLQVSCDLNGETLILINACEKIAEYFYRTIRNETTCICVKML